MSGSNTNPNWALGYVPPPAEWNNWWSNKVDGANGSAINASVTGGTLNGAFAGSPTWNGLHTFNAGLSVANGAHVYLVPGVVGLAWDGSSSILASHPLKTPSINAGEAFAVAPSSAALTPVIYGQVGSVGGTVVGQSDVFRFAVSSDNAAASSAANGILDTIGIYHNVGGAAVNGGRALVWGQLNIGSGITNAGLEMLGISSTIFVNSNPAGAFCQALASSSVISAGVTNVGSLANEFDYSALSGSSVGQKIGLQLTLATGDLVAGSTTDAGLVLTNANRATDNSPGMSLGIQFGAAVQGFPVASTGTMIGSVVENAWKGSGRTAHFIPPQCFAGVDFQKVNFSIQSGFAFRSGGFSVDGRGQISTANAVLSIVSTGVKLDVPNQIVTAVAVSAGGGGSGTGTNDYYVGDILFDNTGGQYSVSSVSVGAVTGLTLRVAGVSASPPANPVALTGGSGINCTATLTWSANTQLSLNPSGGKISLGGNITGGINCDPVVGSSNTDLSHGLNLFGGGFGMGVTSGRLNVVSGGNVVLVGGGGDSLTASSSGVTINTIVGFNNATPIAKPTISGSKASNAALASLLTALASYGLITDSTT